MFLFLHYRTNKEQKYGPKTFYIYGKFFFLGSFFGLGGFSRVFAMEDQKIDQLFSQKSP